MNEGVCEWVSERGPGRVWSVEESRAGREVGTGPGCAACLLCTAAGVLWEAAGWAWEDGRPAKKKRALRGRTRGPAASKSPPLGPLRAVMQNSRRTGPVANGRPCEAPGRRTAGLSAGEQLLHHRLCNWLHAAETTCVICLPSLQVVFAKL